LVETAFCGPMPSREGLHVVDDAAVSKLTRGHAVVTLGWKTG
jgi:hypothetical protein